MTRARKRELGHRCAICLALCALLAYFAIAQNPRGTLRGEVRDASGSRVVGAKVVVNSEPLSVTRETQTDERGEFRIEELPASSYRLTVNATGFAEARSVVIVAISSVREVGVILHPESVKENVVVNADE
jgi:Carboxypeptidase regulatory-like domain